MVVRVIHMHSVNQGAQCRRDVKIDHTPLLGLRAAAAPAAVLLLLCSVAGCAIPLSGMTPASRSKVAIKIERGMTREQVHEALRRSGYDVWQAQYDHDVPVEDALWA